MYQDWMENIPVIGDIEIKGGKPMTDEEKKVIEHLKIVAKERTIRPLADEIGTVLNLIENQQKEIEKYKSETEKKDKIIIEYFEKKVGE